MQQRIHVNITRRLISTQAVVLSMLIQFRMTLTNSLPSGSEVANFKVVQHDKREVAFPPECLHVQREMTNVLQVVSPRSP